VYAEYFSGGYRYPSYPVDPDREGAALAGRILQWWRGNSGQGLPPVPDLSGLSWERQKAAYAAELAELALSR
jgi:hypothetical protein